MKLDIQQLKNGELYLEEIFDQNNYIDGISFKETMSIFVIKDHVDPKKQKAILVGDKHISNYVRFKIALNGDGWYTVSHYVITEKNPLYEKLKNTNSTSEDESIIEIEYIDDEAINRESNFLRTSQGVIVSKQYDIIHVYDLLTCYLNYCREILNKECLSKSKCLDCDDPLLRYRDLLWIYLNYLKYCNELGLYDKAQKFIESLTGCNTLCDKANFETLEDCNCHDRH